MPASQTTNSHQRMTLAIVGLFAVLTLVFGVFSIKKSIIVPFFRKPGGPVFKTQEQLEKEQLALLKTRDTDSDTLSDYDELYIYRTSPYLDDSDSDGIPDAVEIAGGKDPNCPEGKSCRVPRTETGIAQGQGTAPTNTAPGVDVTNQSEATAPLLTTPSAAGTVKPPVLDPAAQLILDTFGDVSQLTPEQAAQRVDMMSPAEMRTFFLNLGLPKSSIDKATDEELRGALLQTIQEMSTLPTTSASNP